MKCPGSRILRHSPSSEFIVALVAGLVAPNQGDSTAETAPAVTNDDSTQAIANEEFQRLSEVVQSTEKFVDELFGVFMTGDKDMYDTDVRGMNSMRDAMQGLQTTTPLQLDCFELQFAFTCLAQLYSVIRQIRSALGHQDRFTTTKLDQDGGEKFDKVTLHDAKIPYTSWRDCNNSTQLGERCEQFLKDNILARDRGCMSSNHKELSGESEKISLDKAIRSHLLRTYQIELGAAQRCSELINNSLAAKLPPDLVTVLKLYARAWNNFATPW